MHQLPQADRFADTMDDNPYWNESVWFSFSIPEQRKHGAIQYYFRPNMNLLNGGPMLWDASGLHTWNALYYNWSHLQARPPGAEKFNMRAYNSLAVQVLEPLQHYRIAYDQDDFILDLEWTALGPIHELKSRDSAARSAQKFHLEQPGRMRGTMIRDGEYFAIDCFSMRDTSFGPRVYSATSGGYFWGISEERAFHAIVRGAGPEQSLVGGFLWRDGQMASLVSGRRQVLDYDAFGPRRVVFAATDTLGRELRLTGELDAGFVFTGYTDHTVVWSLAEWQWDGITHWGDNQEFCSALRFRRIARGDIQPGEEG